MKQSELRRRNVRMAATGIAVAVGMIGLSFAFVPFYDAFCRALGLDGATQIADSAPTETVNVPITIRLDSNVDKKLPWQFYPAEKSASLMLGETRTIHYVAKNMSDRATTGTATFNVTPEKAGLYFNKIDCFCFQEQTLQPGETVDMAVSFFVDPDMIENSTTDEIRTITLSYTFFRSLEDMMLEESAEAEDFAKVDIAAILN
jgi:cytochrome c oxidase assembly protein subunit 11